MPLSRPSATTQEAPASRSRAISSAHSRGGRRVVPLLRPGLGEHHEVGGQPPDQVALAAVGHGAQPVGDLDVADAQAESPVPQLVYPVLHARPPPAGSRRATPGSRAPAYIRTRAGSVRVHVADAPAHLHYVHQVPGLVEEAAGRLGVSPLSRTCVMPVERGLAERAGNFRKVGHSGTLRLRLDAVLGTIGTPRAESRCPGRTKFCCSLTWPARPRRASRHHGPAPDARRGAGCRARAASPAAPREPWPSRRRGRGACPPRSSGAG